MRSSPANASLICVPMFASWTTGIAISAVNDRYMTKSPIVISPARIDGSADQHHRDQRRPEDQRRGRADRGHAGQRLGDVAEQPVRALGEHHLLALLGRVGLDDADAAERFGQPARHLGVDRAALAEQRPQPLERHRHAAAERAEDEDRDAPSAASSGRTGRRARATAETIEPASCTRPVPTRFRMPSASVMMREMRTPVLVESK